MVFTGARESRPFFTSCLVAVLLSAGIVSGCGTAGQDLVAAAPRCPSAPFVPEPTSGDVERAALQGPAPADVRGGAFVRTLRLDNDGLVVTPPRAHDTAGLSGDTAMCEVLASTLSNGAPVGPQTRDGVAVGLGRVTVSDALLDKSRLGGVTEFGSVDGVPDVNPRKPAPTPFHDRLSWVVVVQDIESSSCGADRSNSTPPPRHVDASLHGYAVFVVDASSGSDALLYTERMNPNCPGGFPSGPWVDVPLTTTSVGWRLVSRLPDNTRGVLTFQAAACDGYAGVITAGNSAPLDVVRVLVTRPFGPPCRPFRSVTEELRARNVGTLLPNYLRHAPLGPYVGD